MFYIFFEFLLNSGVAISLEIAIPISLNILSAVSTKSTIGKFHVFRQKSQEYCMKYATCGYLRTLGNMYYLPANLK